MTYETYHLVFVVAAALAGVFFAAACIVFAVFKIPKVAGDLSGTTARKAIQSIREQSSKEYKNGRSGIGRNKRSERALNAGHRSPLTHGTGARTEKISSGALQKPALPSENPGDTERLGTVCAGAETTVLSENMILQPLFEIEQDITFIHTEEIVAAD